MSLRERRQRRRVQTTGRSRKHGKKVFEIEQFGLEATTRKTAKGWETGLLWKEGLMPQLNSRATALKRLYSFEKKLDRNPEFAALYYREMNRLFENGYAVKVSGNVKRPREWFVPHFGVQNTNKPEKVRLVFDAACPTKGISLNCLLETDPDLLESLVAVLLRFRQFPIAVKADISDMYLRISVVERDRGAQRFLWRGVDRNREPDVYENTSLVFGSKSSPCSAIYIKNKNAEIFAKEKPEPAHHIVKSSYMDDFLASGTSVEQMQRLVNDVIRINSNANFNMHGWASNDDRVVDQVCEEKKLERVTEAILCDIEDRILGLFWDRIKDVLRFNVGAGKIRPELLQGDKKPTKRELFSIVMSVYDPLGILAQFIVQAKFIVQDLWISGVKWDSQIRDEEFKDWVVWLNNLIAMKRVEVPRCYLAGMFDYSRTQLHVFCDASSRASAVVAYLRTETNKGTHLAIIMSKTQVATTKKRMTIPRLELQAALLGAKLAVTIQKELDIKIEERVFWSDSTTVLHWIRAGPHGKQIFVANRLEQISERSRSEEWRWVPTKMNSADDATRRLSKPMQSDDRWLIGLNYLLKRADTWPTQKALDQLEKRANDELEARKEFVGTFMFDIPDKWNALNTKDRVLGWSILLKVAANVRKYFYIWHDTALNKPVEWKAHAKAARRDALGKKRERVITIPPHRKIESDVDRRTESEKVWYRVIQTSCFLHELNLIKKGKAIPLESKLITLNPFIDNDGLLRTKGRVLKITNDKNEEIDIELHPIILDANHFTTKLLIYGYHRRYNHANDQTVINELRQQFYIVRLRTTLRSLAQKCVICRKQRGKAVNPPMAALPACRVAYRRLIFLHCGIDYFGPMVIKVGRRREKRWGVLFTCMTTRAIHIELAESLNADSAIRALTRFAKRRGFPRHLYSDNGTNFVKASKELKDAIEIMTKKDTGQVNKKKRFAKENRFEWHFNPPTASHMGGAWERLIRSVKNALHHALDYSVNDPQEIKPAPTGEVLHTLLIEIEHMVNSRPLTLVSVDP
ncbi:uncharacterized protein LOC131663444 [Phymastichus coffea]|uniref:uncharacterized protein LOC131663444 n=1 Tax=Phymastichus coffea TaxID=108790 RepID=UPI00273B7C24|nr:uncharacterized protein LOC131663444 [Phymastichus coffea]